LVLAAASAACSKSAPGTPGAAYEAVVAALEAGDDQSLYGLLAEDLQQELAAIHGAATEAVTLIDASYPPEARAAARQAAGADLLAEVDGPAALFRHLSAGRARGTLSSFQRLGSGVAGTTVEGDVARVRTRGGDVWEFRQAGDGGWRWLPPEPDRRIVADALARATANLTTVREAVTKVETLRARGTVRALSPDAFAARPAAAPDAAEPAPPEPAREGAETAGGDPADPSAAASDASAAAPADAGGAPQAP
jgi:hypothetical protein